VSTAPALSGALVLHVEDDALNRQLVGTVLARYHPEVELVSVASLAEARSALQMFTPDLILLDLLFPDGLGSDLLPTLPRRADGHPPPVVLLTSRMAGVDVSAVVAYLTKPFDLERLLETVGSALGGPTWVCAREVS
jgi:DNA-binding response OmpR family regulator